MILLKSSKNGRSIRETVGLERNLFTGMTYMMRWGTKPSDHSCQWWVDTNRGWCLQMVGPLPCPADKLEVQRKLEYGDGSYEIVIRVGSYFGTQTSVRNRRRPMFFGPCGLRYNCIAFCNVCNETGVR